MPVKQLVGGELYRYAFQGQEKDPETGKEAFQLRLWDGRIGRWLTTDPAGQFSSPYLGMGNNPINGVDPDGAFWGEFWNWFKGNGWNTNEDLAFNKQFIQREVLDEIIVYGKARPLMMMTGAGSGMGLPPGTTFNDLPDVYIEANAGVIEGQWGGHVSLLGTKIGFEGQIAKSNIENIGFKIDTSNPYKPFEDVSGLSPFFSGETASIRLDYFVGGEAQFDLKTRGLSQLTTSALVTEFITEYHVRGIHKGEISKQKMGFDFGGSIGMFYGAEANFKVGFIIPRNND